MIIKKIKILAVSAAFIAVAGYAIAQHVAAVNARGELTSAIAFHHEYVAELEEEARKTADEYRAEEARRTSKQLEIINENTKKLAVARSDAMRARADSDSMRQQLAKFVAASNCDATENPGVAGCGKTAGTATSVLADMLNGVVDRATKLAEIADSSRIAGETCEKYYDALTTTPAITQ